MSEKEVCKLRRDQIAGRTPSTADGRGFDEAIGAKVGEAASIQVKSPEEAFPIDRRRDIPVRASESTSTTYYDLPILKEPVWKAYIPAYFYTGGVVGAAAALGAAAQLLGGPRLRPLVRRARWTATIFSGISAVLLIADLGRPSRFLYMLRVFRPTSPMNVGTWIVSASGATSGAAAIFGATAMGDAAGLAAGLFGLPMAGYTAVLLANTAVPVWQAPRRALPATFMASGVSAAASLLEMGTLPPAAARAVRVYGLAGKLAEIVAMRAVEHEIESSPAGERIALPLKQGVSGFLWRAAKVLTAASVVTSIAPALLLGGARRKSLATGLLGTAGALALRFAIVQAGKASARDPRATFEAQRAQGATSSSAEARDPRPPASATPEPAQATSMLVDGT